MESRLGQMPCWASPKCCVSHPLLLLQHGAALQKTWCYRGFKVSLLKSTWRWGGKGLQKDQRRYWLDAPPRCTKTEQGDSTSHHGRQIKVYLSYTAHYLENCFFWRFLGKKISSKGWAICSKRTPYSDKIKVIIRGCVPLWICFLLIM